MLTDAKVTLQNQDQPVRLGPNLPCSKEYTIHSSLDYAQQVLIVIIKPADKGGAVVIMNMSDYCNEANRQLQDSQHHQLLSNDPTVDFRRELLELLEGLPAELGRPLVTLVPEKPRQGLFYLLPKIRTTGNRGRPIISCSNTLCENISGFVERVLKPVVRQTPSFLLDTTDLWNKLK